MKILSPIPLLCLAMLLATAKLATAKDLVMATANWPPWVIIKDHNLSSERSLSKENDRFSGINIDIAKALAKKLELNLVLISCSWSSCINLHKSGKSDLLDSLLQREERKAHMHFLTPAYKTTSDKVIYLNNDSDIQLNSYQDLYKIGLIGVTEATKYSPQFDSDDKLNKLPVESDVQLFAMLKRNRIDAFIMDENIADYMLSHSKYADLFTKSLRFNENKKEVFFALSKKSPLVSLLPEFNQAMSEVLSDGFVDSLVKKYTQ